MTGQLRLDPEFRSLFDGRAGQALTAEDLPRFRADAERRRAALPRMEIEPRAFEASGSGSAPPVPVLVYQPPDRAESRPALLHMHGGGMFSGSPILSPYSSAAAALDAGFTVVSVDYRLAPETRFPGQIEDCYAALAWLHNEAHALDIDPALIAVSGDSAGGGLAAALALMVRDRGEYCLRAQVLTYPMLDCRTGGGGAGSDSEDISKLSWTGEQNRFGWAALRGDYEAEDERQGWFSPALAANLSNLPPAWIGVGTLDLFHDECEAYVRQLASAGVDAHLCVYPGAPHAFNGLPEARVSKMWRNDILAAFRALSVGLPWPR